MLAAIASAFTMFCLGGADCTACRAPQPIRLSLQVVLVAPMPKEALETVMSETAAIWAPYNVIISPVLTLLRPDDGECRQWITLIIRNQPANRIDGAAAGEYPAIASVTFTGPARPGDTMYASLESARGIIRAAQLDRLPPVVQERLVARLLGRAIAHEIGHYLLRSEDHSAEGLMRASFGVGDLMAGDLRAFRLRPEQAAVLR